MRPFGFWGRPVPAPALVLTVAFLMVVIPAAVYAALSVEHAFAMLTGSADLNASLLAWMTTDAPIFGERSMRHFLSWYQSISWGMGAHFFFGIAALLLGVLQFVPPWRHRYPQWHRAGSLVVWAATLGAMLGALGFLIRVPMNECVSGPAFGLVLWGNTLATLFMLSQAATNALARDFRSHMVWTAMLCASMTTAPMLRIDWVLLSYLWRDASPDALNLAAATFVLPQTAVIMGVWLTVVGDRDLRARPAGNAWPAWLTRLLCAITAAVVLHEGVLAPNGIDVFGELRSSANRLPLLASPWAVAMASALLLLPSNWGRLLRGWRPQPGFSLTILLVAATAAAMGQAIVPVSMEAIADRAFWLGYAVLLLVALALAHLWPATSQGRNAWGVLLCTALWLPATLPGLSLAGIAAGATFAQASTAALIVGLAGALYFGGAYAFGARVRLPALAKQGAATMLRTER